MDQMKQPDSLSLLRSEVSEFLFAAVGEERNGMTLSVFSTLARLGIDPWAEAARLAGMPSAAAADALSQTISGMSGGCWQPLDTPRIAARLVRLLPKHGMVAAAAPGRSGALRLLQGQTPIVTVWLLLAALLIVTITTYRGAIFGSGQDEPPISSDSNR